MRMIKIARNGWGSGTGGEEFQWGDSVARKMRKNLSD